MSETQPTYDELKRRLEEAEAVIEALRMNQVDAVVGKDAVSLLRRREIERKLSESEARYRRLFECMSEGFALYDVVTDGDGAPVDFRHLTVNPAFESLTGLKTSSVIDRTVREVLPQVEPKWLEALGQAARTGESVRTEDYNRDLDGWFEAVIFRPEPGRVAVVFSNVTARRRGEEALRESLARAEKGERTLRALMENVPEGLSIVEGPDMRLRMVSLEGERILGEPHEGMTVEEVARRCRVYHNDGETPMALEELPLARAALKGEVVRNQELVQFNSKGERLFLSCNAGPIIDSSGKISGAVVAWRDVTEAKRSDEMLRENWSLLQAVIRQMPSGLIVAEAPSGKLILSNDRAAEILGHPLLPADCQSGYEKYGGVFPDVRRYRPEEYPLARALAQGEFIKDEEVMYRRGDGRIAWLSCSAAPIVDERGSTRFAVVIFDDISERKHMEQNLHQAKEAAEAANRSKSEFLANMSHEIRTPISSIMGATDMALGAGPDERQKECLDMIRSSAKSLLGIINDILDLSRIEAGKLELVHEDFDLTGLLRNVLDTFMFQTRSKGIGLYYSMDPGTPQSVVGDPGRLRQVLVNLVGNAVKFTEQGEVKIKVGRVGDGEEGNAVKLRFTVTDTGIGVPEDKKEALFESFTQANGSTSKKHGGTGLGLTICQKLVGMMGGSINVESAPGEGARFCFTVSLGKSARREPDPPPREEPWERVNLRGLRILVAEDNEIMQKAIQFALEKAGAEVAVVSDGRESLSALENGEFDLVFMDVQMPEMDGVETTRKIRSSGSANRRVPIVALTAYAMKGDRERFLRAGMDDYVSKPVENHDLYEVIRRVMTGKTKKEKPAEKTEDAGGGAFDLESLKARYEGHEELFKNIVSMFLQQAPEELDKLQRALDNSDLAGAAKASHGLVGMCSVFGRTKLIEYGSELEETAHNNDAENAVALFQKLREEMSSVLAVLSREVER